jgi:hypothetical protein
MSFRCILSLISSQSHRNVHGFKKGIHKYISSSESRFRPYEPDLMLRMHENYASMHTTSNLIRDASKRARFQRQAFGSA